MPERRERHWCHIGRRHWYLAPIAVSDALDDEAAYHLVVAAGNVMIFLAPGTGPDVVARLARALLPGGLLVSGWRTDELAVAEYDAWAGAAGLTPVARHAGWDREVLKPGADWCVAVDRRPPATELGQTGG